MSVAASGFAISFLLSSGVMAWVMRFDSRPSWNNTLRSATLRSEGALRGRGAPSMPVGGCLAGVGECLFGDVATGAGQGAVDGKLLVEEQTFS